MHPRRTRTPTGTTPWSRTAALSAAWLVAGLAVTAAAAQVAVTVVDALGRAGAGHRASLAWGAAAALATLLVAFPLPAAWLARHS